MSQPGSRSSVAGLLLVLLLFLGPVTSAEAQAVDPLLLGPNKIGFQHVEAFDADRGNRPVPLDIWYPVDPSNWIGPVFNYDLFFGGGPDAPLVKQNVVVSQRGKRRLIVFSHGYGGIALQSTPLMEQLASYGFIVVSPTHTGNTQGDTTSPDPAADRSPDISFVIDEMELKNTTPEDPFFGRLHDGPVGVAGHSFGGMTAMMMVGGYETTPPDPRVGAIFPIAPSSSFLSDYEIQKNPVPTFFLVGTLDTLQAEVERSFDLLSIKSNVFRADLIGANHTHFANVCQIGNWLLSEGVPIEDWPSLGAGALVPIYQETCIPPALDQQIATDTQNLYATAFFRYYLQEEAAYGPFLTEDYANANQPLVDFWGTRVTPIPALPTPLLLLGLGGGLLASGAAMVRRRSIR